MKKAKVTNGPQYVRSILFAFLIYPKDSRHPGPKSSFFFVVSKMAKLLRTFFDNIHFRAMILTLGKTTLTFIKSTKYIIEIYITVVYSVKELCIIYEAVISKTKYNKKKTVYKVQVDTLIYETEGKK